MTRRRILIGILCMMLMGSVVFAADESAETAAKKTDLDAVKTDFRFSDLKVEKVEEPLYFTNNSKPPYAKYAVKFTVHPQMALGTTPYKTFRLWGNNLDGITDFTADNILDMPTGKKLSAEQKSFISKAAGRQSRCASLLKMRNSNDIYVLGVDEDQAQYTAKVFFEILIIRNKNHYKLAVEDVQQAKKEYQEAEKELETFRKKMDAAQEKFQAMKKKTHYQDDEEASKAIKRMNQIVEDKDIELEAVKAKLVILEKTLALAGDRTREKLEDLRFDLEIAFAASQATRQKACEIRGNAEDYLELHLGYKRAEGSYGLTNKKFQTAKSKLDTAERNAADWTSRIKLKVKDNKITLYPIK